MLPPNLWQWRVDYRRRWSGFATTTGRGTVYDNHTASWSDIRTSLSSSLISRWCATSYSVVRPGGRTTRTLVLTTCRRHRENGLWTGVTTLLHSTSPLSIHLNSKALRRCWKATVCTLRWAERSSKRRIWLSTLSRSLLFWRIWVLENTRY